MQFKNKTRVSAILIIGCFLLSFGKSYGQQTDSLQYRNFNINFQQGLKQEPIFTEFFEAVKFQIDLLNALRLSDQILNALQKVPIDLVSETQSKRLSPGSYSPLKNRMNISSKIIKMRSKPILIHELMHAYQHKVLPDGTSNTAVTKAFDHASKLNMYNAKSHMMKNIGEYFACFATTYLYGITGQEPFTREKIKASQPDLYEFMQKTFGKKSGNYAGKLE
ncbi:anthrax toxin lethal factor-related metalloendopeptidase [Pedobacter endophyticus]|uniref:Anthrax toxin lethal/endema factor N-/C-terminal domain-containing protein n=1 Tax=Pedobacter endophyticus TaxID=2789740 RepID=A0A7S9KZH4_9SPHI|nr:hypothetical protein [Pedobacter endophyticus]QPH39718.1 hypothetical protein IZT61_00080 [Pedobacter endophyticus]